MKLISMPLTKGFVATIMLALLFLGTSMEAQTSFSTPGATKTSPSKTATKSSRSLNSRSGTSSVPKTTRSVINKNTAGTVLKYSLLTMSENGYIMLDLGDGAEIFKNAADKPYTSIIAALNKLVGVDKWRVVNSYNVTNENPFPSFLLNKHVSTN